MLRVNCEDKFKAAKAFAAQNPELELSLERALDYLDSYANSEGCYYDQAIGKNTRCTLYSDCAPHSFGFTMECRRGPEPEYGWEHWFAGGLIFHGNPDQSLAIDLSGGVGWSIHT